MSRIDAWRMIRRRAKDAGLDADTCCHTFRATGITAYLDNGGTLENAQVMMAAHESPRTTKLYDRTGDPVAKQFIEQLGDALEGTEQVKVHFGASARIRLGFDEPLHL